jgi:hypothetical protein
MGVFWSSSLVPPRSSVARGSVADEGNRAMVHHPGLFGVIDKVYNISRGWLAGGANAGREVKAAGGFADP